MNCDAQHTLHRSLVPGPGERVVSCFGSKGMFTLNEAMKQLNYHDNWLEMNFISQDYFNEQLTQYQTSDDKNTEHYRYAAFGHILKMRQSLTDGEVANYIELTQIDPDQSMAIAALIQLLKWSGLTDQQAIQIKQSPAFLNPTIQKIAAQQELLKQLDVPPLTAEIFELCLASKADFIQRKLFTCSELTAEQLGVLRQQGANRAIRNMANQKLLSLQRNHI